MSKSPQSVVSVSPVADLWETYPPRFATETASDAYGASPHFIEQEVQRELLSEPNLKISSLVIRRVGNGVCLQGVLECGSEPGDVSAVAQRVAGVEQVLNHLVVAPRKLCK